jgi:hypothetical protein
VRRHPQHQGVAQPWSCSLHGSDAEDVLDHIAPGSQPRFYFDMRCERFRQASTDTQ